MPAALTYGHTRLQRRRSRPLLILRDVDPPKLHDLDRLAQRLPDDEGSAFAPIELPELTRWSIDGRYPADLDEATQSDAVKAIVVARQVLDLVRPRITPYA